MKITTKSYNGLAIKIAAETYFKLFRVVRFDTFEASLVIQIEFLWFYIQILRVRDGWENRFNKWSITV